MNENSATIDPSTLSRMQEEARLSLQAETLENVHRTQIFSLHDISPTSGSPFWIRSWTYKNDEKAHSCWKNFPLELNGVQFERNMKLIPAISKFIEETGPYYVVGLSMLPPGCQIEPHRDHKDQNIVCHIPLITNESSKLMVDGKPLSLGEPGKMVCFDQSQEHSSGNNGTNDRITLYLERYQ